VTTYKQSAVTAKEGINFVRSVVESGGSLFIKIEQENDLGIDALIEFVKGEKPLNKQIAVQIKSGASYYTSEKGECAFPVGNHRTYWKDHPLPVFGMVYVPALNTSYWVNIKGFLKDNPEATTVRFPATEANRFDLSTFNKLFLPGIAGEIPELSIEEAFKLARSPEPSETYLGLLVLFRRFADDKHVWDELIRTFIERPQSEIPPVLIYWLAHIPGHGDIFYFGQTPSPDTKAYAKGLLSKFRVKQVIKMLTFVDPEQQFGRGTLGQSVDAIISSLPEAEAMLHEIVHSPEVEMPIREYAVVILAMNQGKGALGDLQYLHEAGSWYAGELAHHIEEFGMLNPYA